MDEIDSLRGDLRFVRGALDASTRSSSPPATHFLWAVIVLIGFALADFRIDLLPEYWAVTAPVGFLASAYLGWRHAQRTGQMSAVDGRRHMLHWGAMLVALALAVLIHVGRPMPGTLHTMILLLLALGYFTAGLHLERSFLWAGILMGIGSIVVTMVSLYAWTIVGVAVAAALTLAGITEGRRRDATA